MIARLIIEKDYLPDWYIEDCPAHIPLPEKQITGLKGKVICWALIENERIPLISIDSDSFYAQHQLQELQEFILFEKYRNIKRPFYTRLPFHYHNVPGSVRNILAGMLLASNAKNGGKSNGFPGFPIEQGFEALTYLYQKHSDNQQTEVRGRIILTHDIDTRDGFEWVDRIAKLEMEYGFKSLWNVVGNFYEIDYKTLDWLVDNGFEVGLHGYNHDNKLIFLSEDQIRFRLDQCFDLMKQYNIKSFRSPSWFRNEKLYNVLKDYFEYDYSCPDSDIMCPGGQGGCLAVKSFSKDGLTHIPTTIPFETPLFFGTKLEELVDFWKPKIEWLLRCNGNIVVNTHPDPHYSGNPKMLSCYEELLRLLNGVAHKTPAYELERRLGLWDNAC